MLKNKQVEQECGYQTQLFANQDQIKHLICAICQDVLKNPYVCNCHIKNFCKSCITTQIEMNHNCPISKQALEQKSIKPNPDMNSILGELEIKCTSNEFEGHQCGWVGKLDSLQGHLSCDCVGQLFHCIWKDDGCDMTSNRFQLEEHQKLCYYRKITCQYCKNLASFEKYSLHQSQCLFVTVNCARCSQNMLRKDSIDHYANSCPKTLSKCYECEEQFYGGKEYDEHKIRICNRFKELKQKIPKTAPRKLSDPKEIEVDKKTRIIKLANRALFHFQNAKDNSHISIKHAPFTSAQKSAEGPSPKQSVLIEIGFDMILEKFTQILSDPKNSKMLFMLETQDSFQYGQMNEFNKQLPFLPPYMDNVSKDLFYIGQWQGHQQYGFGKLIFSGNEKYPICEIYEGDFVNGKPHGIGRAILQNGSCYLGEYKNGKAVGHGQLIKHEGTNVVIGVGQFVNNERQGYFVEKDTSGQVQFKGYYQNDKRDGEGFRFDAEKKVFVKCLWKQGVQQSVV